jgi:hypothetical protein
MRPSFVKQDNFDSEMTKFAGKYTLYLYREKGVDNSDQVSKEAGIDNAHSTLRLDQLN